MIEFFFFSYRYFSPRESLIGRSIAREREQIRSLPSRIFTEIRPISLFVLVADLTDPISYSGRSFGE